LQFDVDVVVGQQHPNLQAIETLCKMHQFACHVQTQQMATLMAKADLAIGAGGTAVWERCCMGLPSICISTAENQAQQIEDLDRNGLIIALPKDKDFVAQMKLAFTRLKKDSRRLSAMSQNVYDLVDGNGSHQVAGLLFQQAIQMRLANANDSQDIFSWRNHPTIRHHSISEKEIDWADHEKWFANRCGHPNHPILIGEVKGQAVGVVRFDIRDCVAEVSIYRVPDSGHRGIGHPLLLEAETWLKRNHPEVVALHAQVLQENEPSKKLFEKLHYAKHIDAAHIEFVKPL
jgi:RimJ/RimL family protein N-acetyltransferase